MWPYSQHRLILIIDRESYWPYHKIDYNLNDKVCSKFTHTFFKQIRNRTYFLKLSQVTKYQQRKENN